MVTTAVL